MYYVQKFMSEKILFQNFVRNAKILQGCVDSSVVEHQLCASWTWVQLPVQEPR